MREKFLNFKGTKEVLAFIILNLLLFFGTVSASAQEVGVVDSAYHTSAASGFFVDVQGDAPYLEEVKSLNEAGIIQGNPDGSFRPNKGVTRTEFAVIVCRSLGLEDEAKERMGLTSFSDVDRTFWGSGYIDVAVEHGIITGYPDGTFRPNEPVTNEQVIKMLVSGWGYEEEALAKGGYPNGFMEIAMKHGVIDKERVAFNYGNASKRWVASMFTYNAFKMPASSKAAIKPARIMVKEKHLEKPLAENGDEYITDPVSILKKITPKSAKYERTTFEQKVPSYVQLPFKGEDHNIVFLGSRNKKEIRLFIGGDNKAVYIDEVLSNSNSFELTNVPAGDWKAQLTIKDGPVADTYHFNMKKTNQKVEIIGEVFRYTVLRVQRDVKQATKPFEVLYGTDGQITGFDTTPLVLGLDEDGRNLQIKYNEILEEKTYLQVEIGYADSPDPTPLISERLFGQSQPADYVLPQQLQIGVIYRIDLAVRSEYGDATSYKGTLELVEDDGGLQVKFAGTCSLTEIGDTFKILYD